MSETNTRSHNTEGRLMLRFRVHPDWLKKKTYIPDPVDLVFTGRNPLQFLDLGYLGESGVEMFFRGAPFTFDRKDAEKLIAQGFARIFPIVKGEL